MTNKSNGSITVKVFPHSTTKTKNGKTKFLQHVEIQQESRPSVQMTNEYFNQDLIKTPGTYQVPAEQLSFYSVTVPTVRDAEGNITKYSKTHICVSLGKFGN